MWTPLDEYIATALLKVMNKKKVTHKLGFGGNLHKGNVTVHTLRCKQLTLPFVSIKIPPNLA